MSCVYEFVRNHLCTQTSYFSDTGLAILGAAAASSRSICRSAEFDSIRAIGVSADSIIVDMNTCRENVVLRRKCSKHSRKRWLSVDSMSSSLIEERSPRTGVRMPNVFDVRDVKRVGDSFDPGLPGCSQTPSIPGKGKKRQDSASSGVPNRKFTFAGPSVSRPGN